MSREMQFDYGSTVTTTLFGVWVNAALQLWDCVTSAWVDEASADLADCLIAMTRLAAGDYYADAPAGIDLSQPYTIRYYDAATPTLGTHIGAQAWQGSGIGAQVPKLPTSGTGWTNWTFGQRLAMLCQLFFGPAAENGSQRTVYDDDGETVISQQTIGDDGTTQTQGRVP